MRSNYRQHKKEGGGYHATYSNMDLEEDKGEFPFRIIKMDQSPVEIDMRVSEDKKNLWFSIWWHEHWQETLKLCISPDFYFYELLTDILPMGSRESFAVTAEDAKHWLTERDFSIELEDVEGDWYVGTFMKEACTVDLTALCALPDVSKHKHLLHTRYTGNLYLELGLTAEESEIDIRFSVSTGSGQMKKIPFNYISMNCLRILDEDTET